MVHSRPQYMTIQLLHILAFGAVNLFNCNYSGGCVVALPCFFFFFLVFHSGFFSLFLWLYFGVLFIDLGCVSF